MKTADYSTRRLFILIIFGLFTSFSVKGQQAISYDYDNNGNRIKRHVVILKSAIIDPADTVKYDEQLEKEIQEEPLGEMILHIYPNPTKGAVVVEISGKPEENAVDYSLYNLAGKLLQNKREYESQIRIDLTAYPAGIYILKLKTGEK